MPNRLVPSQIRCQLAEHSFMMAEPEKSISAVMERRSYICKRCRRMKVRCRFETGNTKCQRCIKSNSECVSLVDDQKRQEQANDIIRLEEKINRVVFMLDSAQNISIPEQTEGISNFGHSDAVGSHCFGPQHPPYRGAMQGDSNRIYYGISSEESNLAHLWPGGSNHGYIDHGNLSPFSSKSSYFTTLEAQEMIHPIKIHEDASMDFVDQLNLSLDTASEIFNHFVNNMTPYLPVVVFPAGLNIAYLQASQKILYLAILSVGSAALYPGTQRQLAKKIQKVFAIHIICHGRQSLEIIQALLVCCIWYQPAPSPKQVNCNQMLAMAAVMIEEISCTAVLRPLEQSMEQNLGVYDWDLQFRRAWLGCFILCSSASTRGRSASQVRWSSFGEQCIDALAKRLEPLSSDLTLCQVVRYYIVADNVTQNIIGVDRGLNILTQHDHHMTLESLGREGLEISNHTASSILSKEAIRMFLHEPVMHHTLDTQIFRSPLVITKLYRAKLQGNLDAIESAKRWLNVFLSFNFSDIRNLPTLHFTQAIYAILILIASMYETAGGDCLHQRIEFQNAQVRLYIKWLRNAVDLASRDGNCPAAERLCPILSKIQAELQEEGESLTSDAFERPKTSTLRVSGIHVRENLCEGTAIGTVADMQFNLLSETLVPQQEKWSSLQGGIPSEFPLDLSSYMPTIDASGDISEDPSVSRNGDIWLLNEGS